MSSIRKMSTKILFLSEVTALLLTTISDNFAKQLQLNAF